jgi:hypothetical protein
MNNRHPFGHAITGLPPSRSRVWEVHCARRFSAGGAPVEDAASLRSFAPADGVPADAAGDRTDGEHDFG